MFKIYDGREHFYQWDLDRKLIVNDASIAEVHFCNRTGECSLVCETYKENDIALVDVPNVLLQTDWKIKVYAYDDKHTKYEQCFEVVSRTKPEDYVYTEEELKTWEELEKKIEALGSCNVNYANLGVILYPYDDINYLPMPNEVMSVCKYGVNIIEFDIDGMNSKYALVVYDNHMADDTMYLYLNGQVFYCYNAWDEATNEWENISPYSRNQVDNIAHDLLTTMDSNLMMAQIYTEDYVAQELATFDFIKVVDELPAIEDGLPNKIYLVPKPDAEYQDLFDEYIVVDGEWEWITTKQLEVDMTNYVPKTAFNYDVTTQTLNINIS